MSDNQVISDAAVHAAASAVYGTGLDGSIQRDAWLSDFRKALEAAAPHMLSHEREETRLAHLDAVVNAQTANKLQAQVDAVLTLANELLRDGERADHYADHGQGQATGVREAIEGAEIAHRIRVALRPAP